MHANSFTSSPFSFQQFQRGISQSPDTISTYAKEDTTAKAKQNRHKQGEDYDVSTTETMRTSSTTDTETMGKMWQQEVVTADEYITDPLGRGPKRHSTTTPPPPSQPPPPPQMMRSPPRTPNGGDFATQLLAEVGGLQLQPMFPDALDKTSSPTPPPLRQPQSTRSGGYPTTTRQSYDSPRPPPPAAPHQGYNDDPIPPSPIQIYTSNSPHSNHSHGRNYETSRGHQNTYGATGYTTSPLRNSEREERDPPPQSSSHSGSHHRHHQPQHQSQHQQPQHQPPQHPDYSPHNSNHNKYNREREQQQPPPQYQPSHPDYSPHSSNHHNQYNAEREQQPPPQHRQQQYHQQDEYNRRMSSNSNSTPPPPRREHYPNSDPKAVDYHPDRRLSDSEYNRHSHTSRPHHDYERAPVLENSSPQPPSQQQQQQQQQYYHDHRGHPNDRLSRSDHHHDRHYSSSKPQEYVTRSSPLRESYREVTYEEQTSPLSIPSFVGGPPPESNNEDRFVSPPPYTSPQPSPYTPSQQQQYSSPHHHHHHNYPKETIEGRRRRSTDAKQYRHDHYYPPPPPPESRDDYTGSSSIPTSSTSKHHRSPPQGYHPSHSHHRHGEYSAENPPRPPAAQDVRGHYLVDSSDSGLSNTPPVRPSYNNNVNPNNKRSSSSLPIPNKMVPRYLQAEDNRRQSQARTQILKEIKQATSMRNSALDENDRKFWERQIATLNATFRKL